MSAVGRALRGIVRVRGRASRSEYWWFVLVVAVLLLVAEVVDVVMGTGGTLLLVVWYASLLPTLTLTVRRLHDEGDSGYWFFVVLMPLIGWYWLLSMLIRPSDAGTNAFGPGPGDRDDEGASPSAAGGQGTIP